MSSTLRGARSLLTRATEIERLTTTVHELVTVNQAFLKKIEGNETKLAALVKFVRDNLTETPSFGVL
jgi:hypothetical protein